MTRGRGRGANREIDHPDGPVAGLLHLGDHAQVPGLRVLEDLVELVDGAGRDLRLLEARHPFGGGVAREHRFDPRLHLRVVGEALDIGGEAGIGTEHGIADDAAEALPLVGAQQHDVEIAVARPVGLGGGDIRVSVSFTSGALAGFEVERDGIRQHPDRRGEEIHVEVLPAAGARAMHERGLDHPEGEIRRGEVGDRPAGARGRIAGLAGERHDAAHALGDEVIAWAPGEWTVLAEAGHGGVDDARIRRAHRRVAEPLALGDAGEEVLDEDVGPACQLERHATPVGVAEIHRDAPLVPVHRARRPRSSPRRRAARGSRRRAPVARA